MLSYEEEAINKAADRLGASDVPTLLYLADIAPFCGDAGYSNWSPDQLREIAKRLK